MKRILTVLLTLLMVFTLVGCNSKEDSSTIEEPIKQEEVVENKEESIVGGFIDVEDGTLTDELKEIFTKALEGLTGATYEPQELVATQVVAGTNYKFLANGKKITNPITIGKYYITIYQDLEGNVELKDIEVIEESQDISALANTKVDPTIYDYWVVFYDQNGNELQRTIEHYGTVPSYVGVLPQGFVNWVYKKTDKDVTSFKPITTNTYFVAKCYEAKNNGPIFDPEYERVTCLTSQPGAFINSKVKASNNMEFIFDAKMDSVEWCRCFGYLNSSTNSGLAFQSSNPNMQNVDGNLMFYTGDSMGSYKYVENDYCDNARITQRTKYDVKYNGDASYIEVEGTQVKTFTTGTINTSKEIYIFDLNGTSSTDSKQPLSIYYMEIYKDGSLVRDFIPVRTLKEINKERNAKDTNTNIPSNTLCFYDKENDMYYPSFGDQLFEDSELACLAKGTLITMADGTRRLIETLSEGDLIRVFDHNTGKISNAKIMDYWQYEEKKSGLITLHFTNCIDVNIVTAHGFYNKEENKYVVLDANNINSYIGKHFYNVDNNSWETLLSATYSNEKVDTFFIATEGQFDTVAEGMLNIEDGIYFILRNTFDFDENMKVDKMQKIKDIQQYGLFGREDFKYVTDECIEKYGLANLKVALGKGIITNETLDTIRKECVKYESENILEEYVPEDVIHSAR